MLINSEVTLGAQLDPADEALVKREPMLHRAEWDFAWLNGGELTRRFLSSLPVDWIESPLTIDSRVHMLMPGMWPCIPGWHHDDVPRTRVDKQPDYDAPAYKAEHVMALWGDCSLTEFALGEREFAIPPIGEKVYKGLDTAVEQACVDGHLQRFTVPQCRLIHFNWLSWHRGMPTTKRGFRFFIRATRASHVPARNEVRYNANVYMPVVEEGW